VVNGYGQRVLGRDLHRHALQHMAITAVLDATGGDVRTAQRLSRHADLRMLQRYDDNREDLQERATLLLSRLLAEKH
jgi:integrase/recombinase XerC